MFVVGGRVEVVELVVVVGGTVVVELVVVVGGSVVVVSSGAWVVVVVGARVVVVVVGRRVVVVVGGRVVVVVAGAVVVVTAGVSTMSVNPELPPTLSKIVYGYEPGDVFEPAVNVQEKLGVDPPQAAEIPAWEEGLTPTVAPLDPTLMPTEFPGRTGLEPGASSAQAGIAPTKRTTSRALTKTTLPIRDMARLLYRRVLPSCTFSPLSCMRLEEYADVRQSGNKE